MGEVSEPDPRHDLKSHRKWKTFSEMVHLWLLHSLSPKLPASFLHCEDPTSMWTELEKCFNLSNGPMLYEILVDIYTLQQGEDFVCTYDTKLTKFWSSYDKGKTNKNPPDEFERFVKFLMGLNDTYQSIRSIVMMANPLPTHNELNPIINQEDKHKNVNSKTSISETSITLIAQNHGTYRKPKLDVKERPFCTYCKRPGHYVNRCYQVHGYLDKPLSSFGHY